MPPLDITQTNVVAVVDPDEVVLHDELDGDDLDDLDNLALPAPPRVMQLEEIGSGGERRAAQAAVGQNARLALEVPTGAARVVILALDDEGQVIASNDLAIEAEMTAELFLDLLAAGLDTGGHEAVDLHVRLTPELAAALAAAARKAREVPRGTRPLPSVRLADTPRDR